MMRDTPTRQLSPNAVSRDEFVRAVTRMANEVWDFHDRWGFGSGMFAASDPSEVISERTAILEEETDELAEAVAASFQQGVADEAADVLFVAMGHVEALGFTGIESVDRVTAKNSAKTESTHAIRSDTGKLLPKEGKPHKWR